MFQGGLGLNLTSESTGMFSCERQFLTGFGFVPDCHSLFCL